MKSKGKEKLTSSTNSNSSIFEKTLPLELQVYILSFLNPKDLALLALTKKSFADLVNDQYIWKNLYQKWHHSQHKQKSEPQCYKTAIKQLFDYSPIQLRLQRHIQSATRWLAQPNQWMQPTNHTGIPAKQQLPIYQPSKGIALRKQGAYSSYSLYQYLQEETQQHVGQRLLSIPLYVDDHWAVLTLLISRDNQILSAIYIDSLSPQHRYPTPLPKQHPIIKNIKKAYPNFQRTIFQYQYYHHRDKALSRFIMTKNAEGAIRRAYFGRGFPMQPTLWTTLPTANTHPGESTFETSLPQEEQLHILRYLNRPEDRKHFVLSKKSHAALAKKAWRRSPHKQTPEPQCDTPDFTSIPPHLLQTINQRTLQRFSVVVNDYERERQSRINQYEQARQSRFQQDASIVENSTENNTSTTEESEIESKNHTIR